MIKDLKYRYTFLEGLLRQPKDVLWLDETKIKQITATGTIEAVQGRKKVEST